MRVIVVFIIINKRCKAPIIWCGSGLSCYSIGLATGDCGFNPCHCTVECDIGQDVHTHTAFVTKRYNLVPV